MLQLSRRVGESIVIGDDIFLTVLGFRGGQVCLGFDAPKSVIIQRYEMYRELQSEQLQPLLATTIKYCPPFLNECNRAFGESLVIGDDIFIKVLGSKGNHIYLGFDAPKSVIIHRHEIYQKARLEQQQKKQTKSKKYWPLFHNVWSQV